MYAVIMGLKAGAQSMCEWAFQCVYEGWNYSRLHFYALQIRFHRHGNFSALRLESFEP